MTTLPPLTRPAALLSFDFDGTLHDPAAVPPVPAGLFELLRELREHQQIVWGINTGRSLAHMMEGLLESGFPFLPDWVVAREREIYFPDARGHWQPHAPWNQRCDQQVHGLFQRARQVLSHIRSEIEHHSGAHWLELEGEPAGFVCRSVEEMESVVAHITPMVAAQPGLSWQRNSIYLRFGHYQFHKGSSLAEVASIYHLPAARCFAMGDGHNDLEMLDPVHAAMTACPANAVAEIQRHIAATGGLITRALHGHAAIEALHHFFPQPLPS